MEYKIWIKCFGVVKFKLKIKLFFIYFQEIISELEHLFYDNSYID